MGRKSINYMSGAELRAEIWKSKLSFCHALDPIPDPIIQCTFTYSGDELPADMTGFVRHFTYEHIPTSDVRRSGQRSGIGFERVNFRPFKVYLNGVEIVRSHWTGGFENGCFSLEHGQITKRLGLQMMALATRYSLRPQFSGYSYRDEMCSAALFALANGILKFDDTVTQNSFAYATQIVHNAFLKTLKDEKKVQQLRDNLLIQAGATASYSHRDDPAP